MKNPNKYIRRALANGLKLATGVSFYDKSIPFDVQPLPGQYGVVRNQRKERNFPNKVKFEWSCSVTVDIYLVEELGFASTVAIDDMEELVINAMPSITIPGFTVRDVIFIDSVGFDPINTKTQTINRNAMVYELWLNNAETT